MADQTECPASKAPALLTVEQTSEQEMNKVAFQSLSQRLRSTRSRSWLQRSVVVLTLLAVSPALLAQQKPAPRPTMEQLATEWLGVDRDGWGEWTYLDIDRAGRGVFVVQGAGAALAYSVEGFSLAGYSVRFRGVPIAPTRMESAAVLTIEGIALASQLDLVVQSKSPAWKRRVRLRHQSVVFSQLVAIKAAVSAAREPLRR